MKKFLEIFKNVIKSMDKKTKILVCCVLGFFAVCLIVVIVLGIINGGKLTYQGIENKMLTSAEKYYKDNPDMLPQKDGGTVSVDVLTLIENKYMKDLSKYNKNTEGCSGTVSVTNHNDHYLYIPNFICQEYKSTNLYDTILKDNQIVTEGTGLYDMDGDFVFRGEYPNNYVEYADRKWRILRLTSGNEIRLVSMDSYLEAPWDDRFNVESHYTSGITSFEISRIKDKLLSIYNSNFEDKDRIFMINKNLCIGKRGLKETDKSGSVECASQTIETYPIGMMQANEFLIGSIDTNCRYQTDSSCMNYNYLTKFGDNFWTITPVSGNTYEAYYISRVVKNAVAAEYYPIRIVINVDGNALYKSGNGTVKEPYILG